jgi:hypothetical protein
LMQSGVDHFHARVTQRAGDDLGTTIVAIEPRLSDDDPQWRWGRRLIRFHDAKPTTG